MSKTSKLSTADRLAVFSRVLAAAFGGYALTSAATVLLALIWPAPKAQAVLWGTMLSFAVYTTAVIWAFTTRSATRAWVGMLASAAICAGMAWVLKGVAA
jgi:hypothetical protein